MKGPHSPCDSVLYSILHTVGISNFTVIITTPCNLGSGNVVSEHLSCFENLKMFYNVDAFEFSCPVLLYLLLLYITTTYFC